MKSIAVVLGLSCLLGIALTSVLGGGEKQKPGKGPVSGLAGGNDSATAEIAGTLRNGTAELVRNLMVVIGSITEGVQMILDGICFQLFDLYSRVLYPIVDCLTAILGIQDALCAISDSKCIREILREAAQARNRTFGDDLIGLSAGIKIEIGVEVGKRGAGQPAGHGGKHGGGSGEKSGEKGEVETEVTGSTYLDNYLKTYPAGTTDRKYAVLTLKLLALVVEVILFLAVRVHLPVLLLCPAQRHKLGFDTKAVACPFPEDGKSGGPAPHQGLGTQKPGGPPPPGK